MSGSSQKRSHDIGFLIVRIVIGLTFVFVHGGPKLLGGAERWAGVGKAGMGAIGISFGLTFWGFMAGLFETLGGLGILLGIATRPASVMLILVLIPATLMHLQGGQYSQAVYPLEIVAIAICLAFTGAGRYSLDSLLCRNKPEPESV